MVRYTFHSGLRLLRSRMECTFTSRKIFKSEISIKSCFGHLYFSSPKHGNSVCGCWFSKLGTKLEKKFILENKTQHTHNNNNNNITNVTYFCLFLWTEVWTFSSQITWACNTNQGMILIVNSELLVNLLQCLEHPLLLKRTILCLSKYSEIQLFFGTCVVYTKTIIYLGVVKSVGSLPHLCSKRSNMDIQG